MRYLFQQKYTHTCVGADKRKRTSEKNQAALYRLYKKPGRPKGARKGTYPWFSISSEHHYRANSPRRTAYPLTYIHICTRVSVGRESDGSRALLAVIESARGNRNLADRCTSISVNLRPSRGQLTGWWLCAEECGIVRGKSSDANERDSVVFVWQRTEVKRHAHHCIRESLAVFRKV